MPLSDQSRRLFLATAAGAALSCAAGDGWIELFDGKSLNGWLPAENKDTWKVVNGTLANDGPRSHLFYVGPGGADSPPSFRNFEIEAECYAKPYCNSGLFFHTRPQDKGFPVKGFEIQVNNTALGEGNYRERKKTGSLYAVRNVYKQLVPDDQWFKLRVEVRGKNIQVWVNGIQTVDYTEPTPPVIPPGSIRERFLDQGTFALQGHDGGSKSMCGTFACGACRITRPPLAQPLRPSTATFRKLIELGAENTRWSISMSTEGGTRPSGGHGEVVS